MAAFSLLLLCVLGGSVVYCILMVLAARSYLAQPKFVTSAGKPLPHGRGSVGFQPLTEPRALASGLTTTAGPISVLKPLSGADEGLAANLRSFFEQRYSEFELLCAVRHRDDPAVVIVESLQDEFPHVACRLIVTGEPPYANAKVFSLARMLAAARHDLIVMSDSDIRVGPGMLASIAGEFADPKIALATCPYRAIAGRSLWSRLEAEGMNTEFLGGLLVARMLLGVDFAVGPTIVARRSVLDAVHFERLKEYLAEDFVMGKIASEAGFRVILSRTIVDHRIGSQDFTANMSHRLRWARSTRRSRPWGYIGQLFTNPIPIGLLLYMVHPDWWLVLLPLLPMRAIAAWAVSQWVLKERVRWHLLLVQDILSWVFWVLGFFGNTIVWRGRRYYLHRDGRFEPTRTG